jgi:hypothetical protein
MRKVMVGIFFLLMSIAFVFASSEISYDFSVNESPSNGVEDYVSSGGFFDFYGDYIIVLLVLLVFIYLFVSGSKKKKQPKKNLKRKVVRKKKK